MNPSETAFSPQPRPISRQTPQEDEPIYVASKVKPFLPRRSDFSVPLL
jgi:hypothetical protein